MTPIATEKPELRSLILLMVNCEGISDEQLEQIVGLNEDLASFFQNRADYAAGAARLLAFRKRRAEFSKLPLSELKKLLKAEEEEYQGLLAANYGCLFVEDFVGSTQFDTDRNILKILVQEREALSLIND
jgi:hypothetical protein